MIDLAAIPDQDLKETLELVHPNVLENCDLVTPETLGSNYLLHVSTLKQNELTPYISVRANEVEDNTIPRVYVGKTLLNCLEGYASFLKDTACNRSNATTGYQGGYHIYIIPFEYALRPNQKLVQVAHQTKEHWLIKYKEENVTYKPEAIGEMIVKSYNIRPDKDPYKTTVSVNVIIHNPLDIKLFISDDIQVSKGYWNLEIVTEALTVETNFYYCKVTEPVEVPEEIYKHHKHTQTALEEVDIKKPKCLSW
jgi:hypothetical protein